MEKKTAANIVAFALCFILWINFGVEAIWLIFTIGFVVIVLILIFTMLLQTLFVNFYKKKFLPGFKRITGIDFPLETISSKSRMEVRDNEEILFHKKLDIFTRKLKNGNSILIDCLDITSKSMILIESISGARRDVIPLSDIAAIEGKIKYSFMSKAKHPFLVIRSTKNDVYEIALSTFEQNIPEINEIAVIIKRSNPQVKITLNDLIGNDPVYSARDKRLLLLLPFLMALLVLAIWRLFQHVLIHGFFDGVPPFYPK